MSTGSQMIRAIGRRARSGRIAPSTVKLVRDDLLDTATSLVRRESDLEPACDAEPPPFPVDLVYTWVDGSDPAWIESFEAFLESRRIDDGDASAVHASRFENHDELRFSMRSVHRYADWVRTIHLVTSGGAPEWLADHPDVHVVPHRAILPADVLPTFNSHAIESRLHLIDGLSDHYVYMNDDFFLARPQTYENFFSVAGRPQVPVGDAPIDSVPSAAVGMYAAAHRTNELVHRLTGRGAQHLLLHAPYPLVRTQVSELEGLISEELDGTAGRRLRHVDDVSLAASLAPWYALATGCADVATVDVEYVSVGHPTTAARLRRLRRRRSFDSFCLNWTEQTAPGWDERICTFLEDRFPQPAPWELGP